MPRRVPRPRESADLRACEANPDKEAAGNLEGGRPLQVRSEPGRNPVHHRLQRPTSAGAERTAMVVADQVTPTADFCRCGANQVGWPVGHSSSGRPLQVRSEHFVACENAAVLPFLGVVQALNVSDRR